MSAPTVVHLTSVHTPFDPRIFHKECCSLARAGFQVVVIARDWEEGVRDGARVVRVPGSKSRLRRMTQTVWRVYWQARHHNAGIYHFHDPELIPVGLLLRAAGKQVIYDVHEDMPKEVHSKHYLPRWSQDFIAYLVDRLEAAAARRFSAIVTVTPSIAKRFRAINANTIIVHNYPYVRELVHEGKPMPWASRRSSVAYVGGLTRFRAIREMVAAMALIPQHVDAYLELAGPELREDTDLTELSREAGWARVRHHGFIDQKSTFRILQNVRAGLVLYHPEPNQVESMPQKIFEYMAAGIPVIASHFPLWKEIIGGAGCGIFVDPQNPNDIATAIEYVIAHPAEAEEMGRRGQAAVLQHFNWDTEAEKLVSLYRTLSLQPSLGGSAALSHSTSQKVHETL